MRSSNESKIPRTIPSPEGAADFSPSPLLDAFENFHGWWLDLDSGVKTSASEFQSARNRLLAQMHAQGLADGDRVVVALRNGPLFAAAWAASLAAGASPVLMHSDTPTTELTEIAERSAARFIVTEAEARHSGEEDWGEVLAAGPLGNVRWRRDNGRTTAPGSSSLSTSLSTGACWPAMPLHPTSGTTGGPKIAARPGPCAVAEPRHYIDTLEIEPADMLLCAIPMSHAYAYGMCFLVSLLSSANVLFMRRFHPPLALRALREMGITIFPAAPAMLDFLLEADAMGNPRIVLSAGAPLSQATFDGYRERHGVTIRPLYGTTETGGISIGRAGDDFSGGVGPAMSGVEVAVDSYDGGDSENSSAGLLRVRSSSMMAGYWEEGGISRAALSDGWFETGDLARVDSRGRITLLGRQTEIINALGFKVIPREVEEVIARLPEVLEVKVYAGRHWEGFDIVQAAVACRAPLDEDAILRHCERHLVSYKCPSVIHFVRSLPRTPSGKIAISQLPA
jgi:acyl-coenzyme A synthetase/AMP-(fatty) acid ligase